MCDQAQSPTHPFIVCKYLLEFLRGFLPTHTIILLTLEKQD